MVLTRVRISAESRWLVCVWRPWRGGAAAPAAPDMASDNKENCTVGRKDFDAMVSPEGAQGAKNRDQLLREAIESRVAALRKTHPAAWDRGGSAKRDARCAGALPSAPLLAPRVARSLPPRAFKMAYSCHGSVFVVSRMEAVRSGACRRPGVASRECI